MSRSGSRSRKRRRGTRSGYGGIGAVAVAPAEADRMRSEALSRRRFIVGDELSDFGRSITDVIALVEGVPRDIVDDIPVSGIARKAADEMVILPPSANINACELFGEAFVEAEAQVYEGIVDYLRDGIVGADMLVRICHAVDSSDSLDEAALVARWCAWWRCVGGEYVYFW